MRKHTNSILLWLIGVATISSASQFTIPRVPPLPFTKSSNDGFNCFDRPTKFYILEFNAFGGFYLLGIVQFGFEKLLFNFIILSLQ